MEGADVLYGITMQESGVSRLISVKLSEVPEEAWLGKLSIMELQKERFSSVIFQENKRENHRYK